MHSKKHNSKLRDTIKFVKKIESYGDYLGQKLSGEKIEPDGLKILNNPGKMPINLIKKNCSHDWANSNEIYNPQF